MCATMLLRDRQFPEITIWKKLVMTGLLTITGVIGMLLLSLVETGTFGGASFYGALFLVPVLIFPARLMKIPDRDALNLCAPAGCAMLVMMQFDCLYNGCCFGKYLPDCAARLPLWRNKALAAGPVPRIYLVFACCDRRYYLAGADQNPQDRREEDRQQKGQEKSVIPWNLGKSPHICGLYIY